MKPKKLKPQKAWAVKIVGEDFICIPDIYPTFKKAKEEYLDYMFGVEAWRKHFEIIPVLISPIKKN